MNDLDRLMKDLGMADDSSQQATRPLHVIAEDILDHWTNVYFGAKPYLSAMRHLGSINDMYGDDSAHDIVMYFLSNAKYWRGPDAKRIKAELKAML